MKDKFNLSVIIPCLNGEKTIAVQLNALSGQLWDKPWEVIISDNGSTDASMEIVKSYQGKIPNLRIVDSSDFRDRAHACNVGIKASFGTSVAFCDVDDQVAPGWVKNMGDALMTHDFVVCQQETKKLNDDWVASAWIVGQSGPTVIHGFMPAAGGARIAFKRTVFDALDGFKEPGIRIEDIDFCWRAQLAGFKMHFVPEAVLHIRFRNTFGGKFRQAYLDGISSVLLYTRFSSRGMPWRSWKAAVREWIAMPLRLSRIRSKGELLRWVSRLGRLIGHLHGSFRYKVVVL
jgi:glycosyltransferase involved in cell wall biosynthesis